MSVEPAPRPQYFNGLRLIESVWMTEPGDPIQVRYSWRHRLFTWPWRPWRATYTVIPQVPMKGGYRMGTDAIVMHPATVRQLKEHLS